MIASARSQEKPMSLSQRLQSRIQNPASPAVITWLQKNLSMPKSDLRRMEKLYEKVQSDTITRPESAELDSLMEASAALDVLRARVLLGHGPSKRERA